MKSWIIVIVILLVFVPAPKVVAGALSDYCGDTGFGFTASLGHFAVEPDIIGRDRNAWGDREWLEASIHNTMALRMALIYGNDVVGIDINMSTMFSAIEVQNEYGVDFPDHGETPWTLGVSGYLNPFGRLIFNGRIRPVISYGVGLMHLSADLDNVDDQSSYWLNVTSWGLALEYAFFQRDDMYGGLSLRWEKLEVSEKDVWLDFTAEYLSIGLVARF